MNSFRMSMTALLQIVFEYNEDGFTLDDVKALTKFGDSNKSGDLDDFTVKSGIFDREKTGRKGRGFKAVFALPGDGIIVHVFLACDPCILKKPLPRGYLHLLLLHPVRLPLYSLFHDSHQQDEKGDKPRENRREPPDPFHRDANLYLIDESECSYNLKVLTQIVHFKTRINSFRSVQLFKEQILIIISVLMDGL